MSLALFCMIIIVIRSLVQSQTSGSCWSVLKYFDFWTRLQLLCTREGNLHSFMFETIVNLEEMVRVLGFTGGSGVLVHLVIEEGISGPLAPPMVEVVAHREDLKFV